MIKEYFKEIQKILDKVYEGQSENIRCAAGLIVDAAAQHKNIYIFGCSHAGILAQEMFYRTGGLAIVNPILMPGMMLDVQPVTLTSKMERLDGYGRIIGESTGLCEGDVLIVHSVSGRNNVPVDLSMYAREHGVKVISITNIEYSSNVSSRHPSGKRLFEVSDLCIDNCGCFGDSALEIEGLPEKAAPTSTVIGAAIINALVAEAVSVFIKRGMVPPVFISANVEGGDEHNARILEEYRDNIKYM